MRELISTAAALVKVITSIDDGLILCLIIRLYTLLTITVVFPEPGPAITSAGPSLKCIALFCASLKCISVLLMIIHLS
jgi:hypothetical protein